MVNKFSVLNFSFFCLHLYNANSVEIKENRAVKISLPTESQLVTELTKVNTNCFPEVLAKLVSQYAYISPAEIVYFKDKLHIAVATNDIVKVNELLNIIKSFNIQNPVLNTRYKNLYRTQLEHAITFKNPHIIQALIEAGSNVNALIASGKTLLMCAILPHPYKNQKTIVEMLIKAGASVNSIDSNNNTALIFAIYMNKKEIVKILIDNGADVKFSNPGNSPLGICINSDFSEIAKMLIDAGANLNQRNLHQQTHLANAIRLERKAIVKMLVDAGAIE